MCDNQEGWVKENGFWYYYYSDGTMATGWVKSGNYWYYCYPDGSMAWDTMVEGYYVNADGQWTKDEISREITDGNGNHFYYYIGSDGKAVTGWNKIGETFHYYNWPDGSMTKDNTIDGFDLDHYGDIASGTGWLKDEYSGNWYYLSDGEMTTGWKEYGNSWYYLDSDGKMVTGWKSIDGVWYYFHSDGSMATGWVEDDGGWYFLKANGSMAYNYTTDDGYHLDSTGKMVTGTGWIPVDSWWYYLNGNEKVVKDWLYDQGNWYYLYPEGSMAKGWIQDNDNDKWYYLNSSGEMVTGWTKYGDSWYYLKNDGSMAHNTMVGKYYINDNGEWVPNEDNSNTSENIDISNSQGTSDADSNSNDDGADYDGYVYQIGGSGCLSMGLRIEGSVVYVQDAKGNWDILVTAGGGGGTPAGGFSGTGGFTKASSIEDLLGSGTSVGGSALGIGGDRTEGSSSIGGSASVGLENAVPEIHSTVTYTWSGKKCYTWVKDGVQYTISAVGNTVEGCVEDLNDNYEANKSVWKQFIR